MFVDDENTFCGGLWSMVHNVVYDKKAVSVLIVGCSSTIWI